MIDFISQHSKSVALVTGFAFAVAGATWSFAVGDDLSSEAKRLTNQKAVLQQRIDRVSTAAHDYFVVNQQGDLIYLEGLSTQQLELAAMIFRGNLIDRATPVRNMIGALALAGQLNYGEVYPAYERLNAAVRSTFNSEAYFALKEGEKFLIQQGEAYVPEALKQIAATDAQLAENAQKQKMNRIITQAASLFGALILLCVNLIGSWKQEKCLER